MNIFQLECFLTVADYLSFARAAEELHISQPAVTHQIKALEEELHVKLFRRTTRFVELTTEGMAFLEDARKIVTISRQAVKRFESADEGEIVHLAVGCDSRYQLPLLTRALEQLREVHPNVHPRLTMLPGKQLLAFVENGSLDAALGVRDRSAEKGRLRYRELRKLQVICLCGEAHPLARMEQVTEAALQEEPLIVQPPGFAPAEVARIQLRLLENKKPSQLFFCELPEVAVLLTRAGYGVSILPDIFDGPEAGLEKRSLAETEPLSFGVYCRAEEESAPLRDFLRLIRELWEDTSGEEGGALPERGRM